MYGGILPFPSAKVAIAASSQGQRGKAQWKRSMVGRGAKTGEDGLTSDQPKLAVIIPTRNRGDVIRRSVTSVLSDSSADLEVIVIDDGSTDRTGDLLSTIADRRLRVHRLDSNGNANRARNAGAGLARSGLLAFLDSDDAFEPLRARRLIEFFARQPDVDCLVDGFVETSGRGRHVHVQPRVTPNAAQMRRLLLMHQIPLTNSAIAVRRAAFEAVGGFDEGMPRHQDRELLMRLARAHTVWLGASTDVTKYRARDSMSRNPHGYIAGMDALAARCSDYNLPENGDLFRYLIVRGIVKAISSGQWRAALSELQAWHAAQNLPKDYLRSFLAYGRGRSRRAGSEAWH
jgi:glycosyltransferase involved in cell wall biosynthesis